MASGLVHQLRIQYFGILMFEVFHMVYAEISQVRRVALANARNGLQIVIHAACRYLTYSDQTAR